MKDKLLQDYWLVYLKYWAKEVKETTTPPSEEGFWLWFVQNKFDSDLPEEDMALLRPK